MRAEKDRLLSIDFDQRFKDLLRAARQANVSFYTVRPGGLDAGSSLMLEGTSNLVTLAEQTDGISLTASNDLRTGMAKIAADLSSHYVLGYYTNNTRWDGGARKLTVKLKSTGKAVRARREFRAPTEEEMSSIRNSRTASPAAAPSAGQTALSALARVSPSSRLNAYGTMIGSDVAVVAEIAAAEIEGGRFKQGASVEILLTPKDGQPVTLTGKIDPLMRGTLVRTPAGDSKGPGRPSSACAAMTILPTPTRCRLKRATERCSASRSPIARRPPPRRPTGRSRLSSSAAPSACASNGRRCRPSNRTRPGCSIARGNRSPFR